jgi:cell division protein FtsB
MTRLKATLARLSSQLIIVILVVAGVAFVAIFIFQSLRIQDMREQYKQKQAEELQFQERNTDLQQQMDFLNSPGYMLYVETVARLTLNLARPGETVISPVQQGTGGTAIKPGVVGKTATAPKTAEPKAKSGPESWWNFFFG